MRGDTSDNSPAVPAFEQGAMAAMGLTHSRWLLVWRNVLRQRSRNLMLATMIFFASLVIVYFSQFLAGVSRNFSHNLIALASGDMYISSKIKREVDKSIFDREYEYFRLPAGFEKQIEALPGVAQQMSRLEFDAKVVSELDNVPFRVMSFDVARESRLKNNFEFVEGRMFNSGEYGVILPIDFARRHEVKVGDQIRLLAQAANNQVNLLDYTVTGLFKTQSLSAWFDNYVYVDLSVARVLVNDKQALTRLNIGLKEGADPALTTSALNDWLKKNVTAEKPALDVTPWVEGTATFSELTGAMQLSYMILITLIIILVGASLTFSTMMNILERTKEIATLGALGATPSTIRKMLVGESLVLALLAALAGMFAAAVISLITAHYGIPITNKELSGFLGSSYFFPAFNFAGYVAGLLVPLVIAFFASFVFAHRASRLPIAQALADR